MASKCILEHSGFWDPSYRLQVEVYAFDRRGSGNSKEPILPSGDTLNFERHLEDLNDVVETFRNNHPGKELFIFGHSIEWAYALWYAAHYPQQLNGLILASPPVEAGFKLPTQDTFNLVLSPIVSHHSMFDSVDKWSQAFKESEEYKLISEDELCTKEFALEFLFSLQTKLAIKMLQNDQKLKSLSSLFRVTLT